MPEKKGRQPKPRQAPAAPAPALEAGKAKEKPGTTQAAAIQPNRGPIPRKSWR